MERLRTVAYLLLCFAQFGWILSGEVSAAPLDWVDDGPLKSLTSEPISPIPFETGIDRNKAALGRRLFHDRVLSSDGLLSCASCHKLEKGGDDGLPLSFTKSGATGEINTLTVFNSALNFRLGWRGQYRTFEEQADVALHRSDLMNTTWAELLPKLLANKNYAETFRRLYDDGLKKESVLDAIAEFQRSLLTPNARFDQYLRGDGDALSEDEKRGYELFKSYGCVSCHQGINVGGNLFQKVGIFKDYFAKRGNITRADLGRMLDTGADRDRYFFRVPSLRNVAVTAPYFHDGSMARLEEAVRKMGEIQLGISLKKGEIDLITKFLGTLTGEYQGRSLNIN